MDRQKLYIMTLVIVFSVVTIGLTVYNDQKLEEYLSLYSAGYFIITALYKPRKKRFDIAGAGLFLVLSCIVVIKILDILATI
jgi:4-hydroxybenzoate polyprenyltransferase